MKQNLERIASRLEETAQKFNIQTLLEKALKLENFTVSFDGGKTVKTFETKNSDVELFIDLHYQFQDLVGAEKVLYKQTCKGTFYSMKSI